MAECFISQRVSPEIMREFKMVQVKDGNFCHSSGIRTPENLGNASESPQKRQKLTLEVLEVPTTQNAPKISQLPVKQFAFKWLSDLDHQDAKDHLKTFEAQLQRTGFIDQDPAHVHCCEFRNSIRRQFDFTNHKLQLHTLQLQFPSQVRDLGEVNVENFSWDRPIKTLVEHPAGSPEEVVLVFGVRLLRGNEQLLESVRKPVFVDLMSIDDRY